MGFVYATYVRLVESYQFYDEVDEMIARAAAAGGKWLDHVFLCALVNTAAEKKDCKRAMACGTFW